MVAKHCKAEVKERINNNNNNNSKNALFIPMYSILRQKRGLLSPILRNAM